MSTIFDLSTRHGRSSANVAALLVLLLPVAHAQERYDDHELRDRLEIALGGFRVEDMSSTFRLDSKTLGLGTVIGLEDRLAVEDSASVARFDGYYRFNRAHRIEWARYTVDRSGTTTILDDELQIGDIVFPIDYRIDSDWKFAVSKVSYAWSFINTSRYEVFLGAGLNIRDLSARFIGTNQTGGTTERRIYDEDGALPLPTMTAGMRYSVNDRLTVRFRYEAFLIEVGDSSGRLQDTLLSFDYALTRHFSLGAGINNFNFDLEIDAGGDLRGEIETSYRGFLIYGAMRF